MSLKFHRLKHLLHYIEGAGNWMLSPAEQEILESAFGVLPEKFQSHIKAQLECDYFIERMTHGRVNVFRYYDLPGRLLITDPQFQDLLIKVNIVVDDQKQTANVTFYEGRLFSFEFKKPRKFYKGKTIKVGNARIGRAKDSVTFAINRAEHGRDEV